VQDIDIPGVFLGPNSVPLGATTGAPNKLPAFAPVATGVTAAELLRPGSEFGFVSGLKNIVDLFATRLKGAKLPRPGSESAFVPGLADIFDLSLSLPTLLASGVPSSEAFCTTPAHSLAH
jgi:hypothetical protein